MAKRQQTFQRAARKRRAAQRAKQETRIPEAKPTKQPVSRKKAQQPE